VLVIVLPDRVHFADLFRRQFPAKDVEVIVDRRRHERRRRGQVPAGSDRRSRDRRRQDVRAELRATGWAIIRPIHVVPDPTRPWQLPWLRVQLLLRALLGTRWDSAVWPTARATFRDAIAGRNRIRRAGWFN
jgi:hypothetical protein